ncbi:hypothetical protein EYF80_059928 [Liparis tanakae]|uniref:Uncharacterized protein n=1 Tax=Liparis tanakae TaxID=230148 RepID=A0A4Z2ENG4_9TELE|nr:hypothetical protein EYF80_059928 [Liparis tanakae]
MWQSLQEDRVKCLGACGEGEELGVQRRATCTKEGRIVSRKNTKDGSWTPGITGSFEGEEEEEEEEKKKNKWGSNKKNVHKQ